MMATQNDNDLVPDSCRVAAVDAIWKTIGEINGCHVDHAEWHTRDDAPYNDDDVCFLREQVWRRDQLLVVRYRGWSPSMHRSHHEAELDLPATSDPEVKAALMANTEAAVARGVFGIPTVFVGDEMFFGKDRLGQVEAELAKA